MNYRFLLLSQTESPDLKIEIYGNRNRDSMIVLLNRKTYGFE